MEHMIYDNIEGRDKEIWVKLDCDSSIKNMYEISNYGRIRNKKGKILRPFTDKDGYLKFTLQSKTGEKLKRMSHRLVALQFIPNIHGKPEVNHKRVIVSDDRPVCLHDDNYYENLEWVTHTENINHSIQNKLEKEQPYGENAYTSKYDDETVGLICHCIELGLSNSQIMKKFGYTDKSISGYESFRGLIKHVRSKKTWKRVSQFYNF